MPDHDRCSDQRNLSAHNGFGDFIVAFKYQVQVILIGLNSVQPEGKIEEVQARFDWLVKPRAIISQRCVVEKNDNAMKQFVIGEPCSIMIIRVYTLEIVMQVHGYQVRLALDIIIQC